MSMTLLVALTVLEVLALVAVLAVYVVLLTRRLRSISANLGRIAFGVRAVETQLLRIRPATARINHGLGSLVTSLPVVTEKAERLARR
jgi:hypothetical protein